MDITMFNTLMMIRARLRSRIRQETTRERATVLTGLLEVLDRQLRR